MDGPCSPEHADEAHPDSKPDYSANEVQEDSE